MDRPDDYRGRIGEADSPERRSKTSRRSGHDEPRRFVTQEKPRKERSIHGNANRIDRGKRRTDPHSLKIYQKVAETCSVSEYVIRDGIFHEYDNFYQFVKKLLESVNVALNKKITRGNFVEKKLSELLSPASRDEQKRLSGQTRFPEEIMQCHMVVLGLPRSIFVGNGFGNRRHGNALFAAAKDLFGKMHRIGFVSDKLYDSISKERRFDHSRRLPDFSKVVDCFVTLEKQLFDARGELSGCWPHDLLTALDQPPHIFDQLSDTFKKIAKIVHGSGDLATLRSGLVDEISKGADDDIERKIALQREELLRRERAREMIEPLDDGLLHRVSGAHSALPQNPWSATAVMPFGLPGVTSMTIPATFPIASVPPVGIVNPLATRMSAREVHKVVDMDVDEHPYGRRSPSRKNLNTERRLKNQREEEIRRNEEMERLKRKEEELERKMKEEERRKREIEEEVSRRLEEELAKRNLTASQYTYSTPVVRGSYTTTNYASRDLPISNAAIEVINGNKDLSMLEMEEIRRLVKETENRLRNLAEQDLDGEAGSSTLRTLAALADTASEMNSLQRRDLINELKNILDHSAGPSNHNQQSWVADSRGCFYPDVAKNERNTNVYSSSRNTESAKRRSRSRSPYSRYKEPVRGRDREKKWDKDVHKNRRRSETRNDRDRYSVASRAVPQCAFCSSFAHPSDMCHSFCTPLSRKQQLRKAGLCEACTKKHHGRCQVTPCDYCGSVSHARSICEHPEHMKKLSVLRELAKPV